MLFILIGCRYGTIRQEDLAPAPERKKIAKQAFETLLTSPAHGWVTQYQPNKGYKPNDEELQIREAEEILGHQGISFGQDESTYHMLLQFAKNGRVNIRSSVDGYQDYTSSYRINIIQSYEIIFDTYSVFHELYSRNNTLSGAEYEFRYEGKRRDTLRFISLQDIRGSPSVMELVPAKPTSKNLFK